MRNFRRCAWVVGWVMLAGPVVVWAQTPEASPAPGEEVMRPTQHGLRLTPGMARAFSGMIFAGSGDMEKMGLSPQQKEQMSEATARRIMAVAHRDGKDGQVAMEYLIETFMSSITNGQAFKIPDQREFGEKLQPVMHSARDIVKGLVEDYRPILNAEQMEMFEKDIQKAYKGIDRLEQRLADCREGRYAADKNPLDDLDDEEDELKPPEPQEDGRVVQARNQARWDVQWVTRWTWANFLAGATAAFNFDEVQKAKGQEILKKYEKQADTIQTPEWNARVQRNRVQVHLQPQLKGVPSGPYMYRLEKEYREALRPLQDMTGAFYREVLALATPEQRAAAIGDVEKLFANYGLNAGAADWEWLKGLIGAAKQSQ